ncbi:MFS transporter [Salibacterium aidingense]|uniref:MFS transporter n=1 Tax=Salibacterium aidingense TaxID=384933 RepID=UPI0004086474|nr:MFS transporter [Salibacterium aidingense]
MAQKLAILSISLITVMAGAAISPALGEITGAFPDAGQTLVKLVNTLHAIFIIPFTFISSWLTRRFSKKAILIPGLILYMIGGIGGGLASNIWMLLCTRAVLGISVGLIMPISTSLVSDFYEGRERTSMMGKVSASNQLGGMISMVLAGALAALSWRFTFFVYALAVLVFVLVVLFLPRRTPAGAEQSGTTGGLDKRIIGLAAAMFSVFVLFYSIPTNMAIYLQENDIAGASLSGLIIAVMTLGGLAGGLLLAKVKHLLQSFTVPVQVTLMGAGFSLIGFTSHAIPIAVGVFIMGLGAGTLIPSIYNGVAAVSSGLQVMTAMAVVQSFMYLGQFMSPLVMDTVSTLVGHPTNRFIYSMSAVITLGTGIILLAVKTARAYRFAGG